MIILFIMLIPVVIISSAFVMIAIIAVEAEIEIGECVICGCNEPANGLDDEHCQIHWEAYCSEEWWETIAKLGDD